MKDSNSKIVIVENEVQLAKILPLKDKLKLKAIIQISGKIVNSYGRLIMNVSDKKQFSPI